MRFASNQTTAQTVNGVSMKILLRVHPANLTRVVNAYSIETAIDSLVSLLRASKVYFSSVSGSVYTSESLNRLQ